MERFKEELKDNFFNQRMEDMWNELPEEVVGAGSITMLTRHFRQVHEKRLRGICASRRQMGLTQVCSLVSMNRLGQRVHFHSHMHLHIYSQLLVSKDT